jgi:hypothetical protein
MAPTQRSSERPWWQTRQAARLGREVAERDRPAAYRHAYVRGKMTLYRVVESKKSLLDHLREHGGGEDPGCRADLEDAVPVDRHRFARAQPTARKRPSLAMPEDADGNADMLARVPVEDPAHRVGDRRGAINLVPAPLLRERARVAHCIHTERTQESGRPPTRPERLPLPIPSLAICMAMGPAHGPHFRLDPSG